MVQDRRDTISELLASGLAAATFFVLYRGVPLVDDGAIILRYMDNFAAGHFYCYNAADGPIFGVSGFLHGLLAGFLAWTRWLSPQTSLLASNLLGLFLTAFLTLRLLKLASRDRLLVYATWLLVVSSVPDFLMNIKQGLETPLHLAIILLGCWLVWRDYSRWIWLACAAAVVSKIDAVPVAAVLGAIALWRLHVAPQRPAWRIVGRDLALWGVLPLLLWLGFTVLVFGGPLPQSAYAKLYFHGHPAAPGWGFILRFRSFKIAMPLLGGLVLADLASRLWRRQARELPRDLLFLLATAAYLALYCVYNPEERMSWYYAVPEYLLTIQIVTLLLQLSARHLSRHVRVPVLLVLVVLGFSAQPLVRGKMRHNIPYLRLIENERMAAGRFVHAHAAPQDTLMVGLGHVAREARIHTIDSSGLNSRLVTDLLARDENPFFVLRPRWFASNGLLGPDVQRRFGYALRASYYNIAALYDWPALRVLERTESGPLRIYSLCTSENVTTDGRQRSLHGSEHLLIEGRHIRLAGFGGGEPVAGFCMGLVKGDRPLRITAELQEAGTEWPAHVETVLSARDAQDWLHGYTSEWEFRVEPGRNLTAILITARTPETGEPAELEICEPLVFRIVSRSDGS
jgi:hypothetical protein